MCYLEFLWHFATFAVQSNTFSLTYANFSAKNCYFCAHLWCVCA